MLPLLLSLSTVLGLGCFSETNDDQHLAWLFSGVTADAPVTAVPLYFHGLGHGLSWLYTGWPFVPWLGLLLASLLALATVLAFAVVDRVLRPHLRPLALALALTFFFLLAWLEHWLWFSHLRVSLLLAGTALLFAAQRPGRKGVLLVSMALLLLAWAIRPLAAVLALLATAPAAVLLAGSWRRAWPMLLAALATVGTASLLLSLTQTPETARFRAIDSSLAAVLDYDLRQPQPRTAADSLGVAAVQLWMLGDSSLVSEAFARRAYILDVPHYLQQVLPAKLSGRLAQLGRDYFAVLLLLGGLAWWPARRGSRGRIILLQLGLSGLLLGLAALLKLPPRLALPLLDFWLLTNLAAAVAGTELVAAGFAQPRRRLLAIVGLGLLCALYGAKTWHRHQVLGQERSRHEQALQEVARRSRGQVRVAAGADDLLKSLSPFQTYTLGTGPVLWLSGWPSHDPAQARLYRQLSGHADQASCLRELAARPAGQVAWLLTAPTAGWLQQRLSRLNTPNTAGMEAASSWLRTVQPLQADSTLQLYNIDPQ